MKKSIDEKLEILADAAKYDVSCASSGSNRKNVGKGLGNASKMGICHELRQIESTSVSWRQISEMLRRYLADG